MLFKREGEVLKYIGKNFLKRKCSVYFLSVQNENVAIIMDGASICQLSCVLEKQT